MCCYLFSIGEADLREGAQSLANIQSTKPTEVFVVAHLAGHPDGQSKGGAGVFELLVYTLLCQSSS